MADSEETQPTVAAEEGGQQQEENTPNGDIEQAPEGEATAVESEPQAEESQGEQQAEAATAAEEGQETAEGQAKEEEPDTAQQEQTEATAAAVEEEASAPQEEEQQQQQEQQQDTDKAEEQQPAEQEAAETDAGEEQQAATEEAAEEAEAQSEQEPAVEPEQEEQSEQNGADEQSEQTEVVHENGVVGEQEETQQLGESAPQEVSAASELSEEDKERCRHLFDKKAVDGRLNLKGFKVLFRLMGQVLSSEDAENMFQDGARDENGTIDFDEFCRLYCKFSQAEQERKDTVASSIEKLFPTSDGQPVELKKVESLLMKLQKPDLSMRLVREKSDLGKDDVRRLVKVMDKEGTGLISKNEFVETLCSHLQM